MRISKKGKPRKGKKAAAEEKPQRKKRVKKERVRKYFRITKDETFHVAKPLRRGDVRPGRWIVDHLAKTNPNVARMKAALYSTPRDDLADRLAIIYCELLGLANMEAQ